MAELKHMYPSEREHVGIKFNWVERGKHRVNGVECSTHDFYLMLSAASKIKDKVKEQ